MNILLVSPNTLTVPYPVYPIGLDYVAGSVAARHRVRIADMNVMDRQGLARLLAAFRPEIIGISCRNIDNTDAGDPLFFISSYRELIGWLRRQCPAVIVCGGAGFTIMPERIFAALEPDYAVVGEGERFGLLVEALDRGDDPESVPGVMCRAEPREPPPPWSGGQARLFRPEADHLGLYTGQGGMLNLQTKRGCRFSCIYCPYPRIEGKRHRCFDPDEVAATALALQAAGARYLFVTDSAFNGDLDHSLRVARAFRKAGLAIPWGGFFAPVRMPPEYFAILAECGLRHVEFGTETLSPAMLETLRKPFRVEDVLAAHGQARAAGIHTAHYFLLGGPGESADTVRESLDTIERLDRGVFFFFIGIRIYPHTSLHGLAMREGKIDRKTDLLQPVFYQADAIDRQAMEEMVVERAGGRRNWVVGSGGEQGAAMVQMLHRRGLSGPLWEHLLY